MSPDCGVAFLRSLFLLLVCGGGVDEIQADESHGQSQWPELFPHCGGLSQSPVNIDTACVKLDPSLRPVEPQGYSTLSSDFFTLENNGHSVQMSLPSSMSLSQRFTAVQLHLHWGSRGNGAGSEHLINWQASLAEVGETIAVIAGILFGALGIIITAHFIIKSIRSKKHEEPKQEVVYKTSNLEEEAVQQLEQQQP
ncbi:Carbonic anhydrase 14 [Acipenser ruthenus]|uniref:Carbonic anhydrase 14 n=1 Tax=Acipenser ruthenus TaxID=7906 RepID=A0A444UT52_ACIRT|nr:Carbonic anhydrase 14 [Acipenser ruthenus]